MGEGLIAAPHTPNKHFETSVIILATVIFWPHVSFKFLEFSNFDVFYDFDGNKHFNLFKHWQTLLRPIEKCQRNVLCNVAMDVRAVEKWFVFANFLLKEEPHGTGWGGGEG